MYLGHAFGHRVALPFYSIFFFFFSPATIKAHQPLFFSEVPQLWSLVPLSKNWGGENIRLVPDENIQYGLGTQRESRKK